MTTIKNLGSVVFIVLIIGLTGVASCASSKVDASTNNQVLDSLVAQKNFKIESQTAYPQVTNSIASVANSGLLPPGDSAGAINLIGNSNYLKIEGNSASGYLPYFGERQMGATPGNRNIGIEFDDIVREYRVKRGKKNSYIIEFIVSAKENTTETYNITLQLFSNMRSIIRVNSSQRFPIQYRGTVSENTKEE